MYDKKLIDQMSGLIEKNQRIDHRPGEHDDMVISWLLAYWFITNAQNLSFYGIDSSKIFKANPVRKSKVIDDPDLVAFKNQQIYYRDKVKEIYNEMKEETDEFILFKFENELRDLNNRIVLEEGEKFSVDDLIKSLNEGKRISRAQRKYYPDRFNKNTHGGIEVKSSSHIFGRR
jgi:ABC-type antimicrobial peptide transport system permease subunit